MLELKSGELPLSLQFHMRNKMKHGDIFVFGDDTWMKGLENSMYKSDGMTAPIYCKDSFPICINDAEFNIKMYNSLFQEYKEFRTDKNSYVSRESTREIKNYLDGLFDYVTVDYKRSQGCYRIDLNKFLKSLSPELCIKHNENHYLVLSSGGILIKNSILHDYREEIDYDILRGDVYFYFALFNSVSNVYSFCNEVKTLVQNTNLGQRFSDIYDDVVNGHLTKEEFLKKVVL